MISIITCTIRKDMLKQLEENVAATIGVPYEIIAYDNTADCFGLTKVYNICAAKAKYDILCFAHEDIYFKTMNWGSEMAQFISSTPQCGFVGFAGSTIKSKYISGFSVDKKYSRVSVYHQLANGSMVQTVNNPLGESFSEVVVMDGLCLFLPRKIWLEQRFDEVVLDGFHGYDIDMTLQVAQRYKNFVCHTIGVVHLSGGNFSKQWLHYAQLLHAKWHNKLPVYVANTSPKDIARNELIASRRHVKLVSRNKLLPPSEVFGLVKKHWSTFPFSKHSLAIGYDCLANITRR